MNNQPFITAAGLQAAIDASQNGLSVRIAEVAVGEAGYTVPVNELGQATQVRLREERQRVPALGSVAGDQLIDIEFLIDGDLGYTVREIGYFLEDGTLFAVSSDPRQAVVAKSPDVPVVFGFALTLTAVPAGSVTLAPDAAPIGIVTSRLHAVFAHATASLQLQILDLKEQVKTLQGKDV